MKSIGKSSDKCDCSYGKLFFGVALMAIGTFAFVNGLGLQLNGTGWQSMVMPWYFGGILLWVFGKWMKVKSCCSMHGMCQCK